MTRAVKQHIDVLSVYPELIDQCASFGATGWAVKKEIMQVSAIDLKDHCLPNQRVDDRPFGGGPGMVMRPDVVGRALQAARSRSAPHQCWSVYLSAQGKPLRQATLQRLSAVNHLILLAGRFEGVDARAIESAIDEEISLGDYVLSGGELPAMVLVDGIARLKEGVLGNDSSALEESFAKSELEHPQYTRPRDYEGVLVPEVLTSGDHQAVERYRQEQRIQRTQARRPDLLGKGKPANLKKSKN